MHTCYDSFFAMGTRCEIVLPDLDERTGHALCRQIEDEVIRLDTKLSRYSSKSMVQRINVEASQKPVRLDSEMWTLLSLCLTYHTLTQGAFDITIQPLLELWGFENASPQTLSKPTVGEIETCLERVGIRHLKLDAEHQSVAFAEAGVQIDFGAVGKGYALENVAHLLRENHIENAFVNFGGSSILALGTHPYGDCWRVGVQHPEHENRTIYEWELRNSAISTSGGAHQFVTAEGKQYAHVMHPQRGYPIPRSTMISVCASSALSAEILSTSLLVSNPQQRTDVLAQMPDTRAVEFSIDKNQCHSL